MALIYPSLISADLLNLAHAIKQLDPVIDGYHLDVMDGHFVPNLTWGPIFIQAIAKATKKQLWVHLMVDNPVWWIEKLILPEGSILTFHIENNLDFKKTIDIIWAKKWQVGMAISPKTPLEELLPWLGVIDQALVMSVQPGFSGQQFLPNSVARVQELAQYRHNNGLGFKIAIDGGINDENIGLVMQAGVDQFAAAAAIFGHKDPVAAINELKRLTQAK